MHADSRNEAPAAHRRGRAGVMLRDRLRLDRLEPFARFAQEPACVAVGSRPPFDLSAAQLSRVERYGYLETAIAYADSLVGSSSTPS